MSETTDWEDLPIDVRKTELVSAPTTVFVDDLRHMFVQEDCGGDLNIHLFDLEGEAETFASLNPPEVRRLRDALSRRIAEYDRP